MNFTQLNLIPELSKNQFRNQELLLNGYVHGPQGLQSRQNQAEGLAEVTISDRNNLTLRGSSILESQQVNTTEGSHAVTRNSRRVGTAESPISFDVSCRQPPMRSQQPGMPQSHPRQQSGFNDMDSWQRHIFVKRLQELQRQQQLQQLDEARQHNTINQMSAIAKQVSGDQLSHLINGTPLQDGSRYVFSTELTGGDSKVPNTSQMSMVGSKNWVQPGASPAVQRFPNGLTFSREQGQALHSMGEPKLDQSLYGAPVASLRSNFSQYYDLQGISHDSTDMLTKPGGNHVEKPTLQSSDVTNSFQGDKYIFLSDQVHIQDGTSSFKQGFQGKNIYGHVPSQTLNNGMISENFQQMDAPPRNTSLQEFHGNRERSNWSENTQQKATMQVTPSQGVVALDPTEEKILFNSDDNVWDAPFGRSSNMGSAGYGNSLEGADYLNVFPSIQSGTWSALMQSALAETSTSDMGLQEEWSGLSFQKTKVSTGHQTATFSDNGKQQLSWVGNSLQSASSLSSRPFPLFDDVNTSPSGHPFPAQQQPGMKYSYGKSEMMRCDSSHESIQQSPKETSKWLDISNHQNPVSEGSQHRPLMHSENASGGDAELNAQSIPGSWTHRQSISSCSAGMQPCNKVNVWNVNETIPSSADATLKVCEYENTLQQFRSNNHGGSMQKDGDNDSGMWRNDGNHARTSFPNSTGEFEHVKSGISSPQINRNDAHINKFAPLPNSGTIRASQETNFQLPNRDQLDYRNHVDISVQYKGDENVGHYQQQLSRSPLVLESSTNNSEKRACEAHERKQENFYHKENSNDSYNTNSSQHTGTGGCVRENVWLTVSDSRQLAGGSQKSSGHSGRKVSGTRRFQYHPMGNVEPSDSPKVVTHSQALSHQVSRGLKSHEELCFGETKFAGHILNSSMDMEKGNMKGSEIASRDILPGYESNTASSFERAVGFYPPNRTAQPSQNMLELLQKVDQSREQSMAMHFTSSDCNQSEISEPEASDASAGLLQHSHSSSKGFGLRLAPPTQQLPASNHTLSLQNSSLVVNDLNSRNIETELGEKGHTWLTSSASPQSFPPSHGALSEITERERWNGESSVSGQTGNESSPFIMPANTSVAFATGMLYSRNQLQNQNISNVNGQVTTDPSANISFDKFASHFRQRNESNDGAVTNLSAQASLPGTARRIPPFNLAPVADSSQPISSKTSHQRVSGQQLPVLDAVPVSQPSLTSGMSQKGAFSTMLHNVWANVSTQRNLPAILTHKVPTNLMQSVNQSNSNLESASWGQKRSDVQDFNRRGNVSNEFGACSMNSQALVSGEEKRGQESSWPQTQPEKAVITALTAGGSQGKESVVNRLSDANSIASSSLIAHSHLQDLDRERNVENLSMVPPTENASLQNSAASKRDMEAFGRSLRPNFMHQNYSLPHQMQAMNSVEIDPIKRGLKRFQGADFRLDAQQVSAMAGQQFLYGHKTMARDTVDNELSRTVQCASFPSGDTKMLSFSSEGREDQNSKSCSQLVLGDISSPGMVAFGQHDPQNHSCSKIIASVGPGNSPISPQMAPSWFEQYGTVKSGQMQPMYDAQETAKTVAGKLIFMNPSDSFHMHSSADKVNVAESRMADSGWQGTSTVIASNHLSSTESLHPDYADQSLVVVKQKKRKNVMSELLPWHKEVTQGSQRLQNISMAELDWAQAAHRLIDKVEDESEMIEDAQPTFRPKRRLILTTQLMQQLLRPAPAAVLSVDTTSGYESVTFFVAKLALGDACSLISCLESDMCMSLENGSIMSDKTTTNEGRGNQYYSKVVEGFISRARKLEGDLLRFDRRTSILDLRVECQDLDKFSIINRFAKFHGRGQSDGAEAASSSDATMSLQRTCPQRYVNALPMPRNLPEGVQCLSL